MTEARPKQLAAIWTRDVNPSVLAGRPKIINSLRAVMRNAYSVRDLRLNNLVEHRSASAITSLIGSATATSVSGHIPSLQCLLFSDKKNHSEILRSLSRSPPAVLYCDGVRSFYLLSRLRDLRRETRIVVDFDDLMSRRMEALAQAESTLSFGYLHHKAPSVLRHTLQADFVSKTVARYERRALQVVEDQIGHWADAITMVSPVESEILRKRLAVSGGKAEVHAIPPPVEVVREPNQYQKFSHFFFVGTDTLPQNRLTIERILNLWRDKQPSAPIHIYGQMAAEWPAIRNVFFHGYVQSLHDIYQQDSVLFAPGYLRGGLKTKIAESFACGCAVVGNQISFEGMTLPEYPLSASSDEDLMGIVMYPDDHLGAMKTAARQGQDFVRAEMSPERFEQAWLRVLQ